MDEVVVEEAIVVTRFRATNNPLLRQFALYGLLAAVMAALMAVHVPMVVAAAISIATVAIAWLLIRDRKARSRLVANREGIRIGDEQIARGAIHNLYRLSDPARVVLEHGARVREIALLGDDAERIAKALELDPAHRRTSVPIGAFPIAKALVPLFVVPMLGVFALRVMRVHGAWVWVSLGLALVLLMLGTLPGRADIGADGVLFRWMGIRKYVNAGDIDTVVVGAKPPSVKVTLKDGSSLTIPQGIGMDAPSLARQLEALKSAPHDPGIEEDLLAERALPGWLEKLRKVGAEGSFRARSITPERLWDVLENRDARPAARAAAAVALGPTLDTGGRARIRVVAESTAAPHLRVALESAAKEESDSAELERLLKLVE